MENYQPPYKINNLILQKVASITEKIGNINTHNSLETSLHLRKNNRIKSVHSSLKIEANSLSLNEVRDTINGKKVIGDQKEIKEVKNAYNAYKKIEDVNPYNLSDLKKVHKIMTDTIIDESGKFRNSNEGVFSGDECIFVAQQPEFVPSLMEDLFNWMKQNKDDVHPLILSSIFHYEFVFIHPFSDGNGRMARLWQTILLYKWKKMFEYIPIETQIEKYQEQYYDAISKCHKNGDSTVFIEFMLDMIDKVLDDVIKDNNMTDDIGKEKAKKLLNIMEDGQIYTSNKLMELLNLKSKDSFRIHYLNPALEFGYIERSEPDKPHSRNQRYIKTYFDK